MNNLIERLATGIHPITASEYRTTKGFEDALNRGYVLVKFTGTQGCTELGIRIDKEHSKFETADFDNGTGMVHLEGNMVLNYMKVRCVVDIDISALTGTGNLLVIEKVV